MSVVAIESSGADIMTSWPVQPIARDEPVLEALRALLVRLSCRNPNSGNGTEAPRLPQIALARAVRVWRASAPWLRSALLYSGRSGRC